MLFVGRWRRAREPGERPGELRLLVREGGAHALIVLHREAVQAREAAAVAQKEAGRRNDALSAAQKALAKDLIALGALAPDEP